MQEKKKKKLLSRETARSIIYNIANLFNSNENVSFIQLQEIHKRQDRASKSVNYSANKILSIANQFVNYIALRV